MADSFAQLGKKLKQIYKQTATVELYTVLNNN